MNKKGAAPAILVVGSGNGEFVINLDCEFESNKKYLAKYHNLIGGSGVNYSLRLAAAGFEVLPVLPVGKDLLGERIKEGILSQLEKHDCRLAPSLVNSDSFFMKNVKTKISTIVIDKNKTRTVFSEKNETETGFQDHLLKNLSLINKARCPVGAVLIGHIHSDDPDRTPSDPGKTTRYLIEKFAGKSLIFANLGHSQLSLGVSYWEPFLRKTDIFQLNLSELTYFFSAGGLELSLSGMVEWLMDNNIDTIITMEEMGALGIFSREKKIIRAKGHPVDGLVDSTGAGDAFLSGVASRLCRHTGFQLEDFAQAILEGQAWANYACSDFGAASNCPTPARLNAFKKELSFADKKGVDIFTLQDAKAGFLDSL
ncbi:MAG: carbohydrate kinase family protein [Desulfobacter sp.]|nr:MAG: carbohydrate kinase family protein [Desulfobacter sp.]